MPSFCHVILRNKSSPYKQWRRSGSKELTFFFFFFKTLTQFWKYLLIRFSENVIACQVIEKWGERFSDAPKIFSWRIVFRDVTCGYNTNMMGSPNSTYFMGIDRVQKSDPKFSRELHFSDPEGKTQGIKTVKFPGNVGSELINMIFSFFHGWVQTEERILFQGGKVIFPHFQGRQLPAKKKSIFSGLQDSPVFLPEIIFIFSCSVSPLGENIFFTVGECKWEGKKSHSGRKTDREK